MEKLYIASTQMTPMIYKDFYRIYYKEKLRLFNIFATIIAILLLFGAVYILKNGYGIMWAVIAAWAGVFLLFYPRMMYRKPYKSAKDGKQTTHFYFYETYMTEKTKSANEDFKYSDLKKIIETNKYFFIFHSDEGASVVEKEAVKDGKCDDLANFLKTKTEYKKIK